MVLTSLQVADGLVVVLQLQVTLAQEEVGFDRMGVQFQRVLAVRQGFVVLLAASLGTEYGWCSTPPLRGYGSVGKYTHGSVGKMYTHTHTGATTHVTYCTSYFCKSASDQATSILTSIQSR